MAELADDLMATHDISGLAPDEGAPDSEGEGEPTMLSDDSSEEEEEDEEEARKVAEGFIVDEDDDEGEAGGDGAGEKKKKRRKKKRKAREDDDMDAGLDEEDLELVEENTGRRLPKDTLTRLRRHRESESPPPPSKRRKMSFERDDSESLPDADDLSRIFDDARRPAAIEEEDDMDADADDMDDFIEEDEEEDEEDRTLNEEEREQKRRERRRATKERRRALEAARPELAGIDRSAWDEIYEVFGDGQEYAWALEDDEAMADVEEAKPEMRYQDVFEPSEIQARMLTQDDDLIRASDVPERMQLTMSALSSAATLSFQVPFDESDLDDASHWVSVRLSDRTRDEFFIPDGRFHHLLTDFILAVRTALEYLLCKYWEVPYIWAHKRDYISHFNPAVSKVRTDLLSLNELWKIQALGQKFRALCERKKTLKATYDGLGVQDEYFDKHLYDQLDSIEMAADASEWLSLKYKRRMKDVQDLNGISEEANKVKKPTRTSAYDVARNSTVSGLADSFGLYPHEVALNFFSKGERRAREEPELKPAIWAEQFSPEHFTGSPEDLLEQARFILATELGRDPLLRNAIRQRFEKDAVVSVKPTERGLAVIDEYHPLFRIKYLAKKPISKMIDNTTFLHILAAESALLVNVDISLSPESVNRFQNDLNDSYTSDKYAEHSLAWNEQRRLVVNEAMQKHLLPTGIKWVREWLKETEEDDLALNCGSSLEGRIDSAPYRTAHLEEDEIPAVVAVSHGKGDPQTDVVEAVYVDEYGRMREHLNFANLNDETLREEFGAFVRRRKPDVVAVAGLSIRTHFLMSHVQLAVGKPAPAVQPLREQDRMRGNGSNNDNWGSNAGSGWGQDPVDSGWGNRAGDQRDGASHAANGDRQNGTDREDGERYPDIIFVLDEVARVYQNSRRAAEEFGNLSLVGRYCVGLARYVQSPLNEYAALGEDVTVINLLDDQKLLPKHKHLAALERALVTVVNRVGVDVNRAVTDSYYQHLLRFVCGLGPRKAQSLIRRISTMGGTVVNRVQLAKERILTWNIFLNASAFLRIAQDPDIKGPKRRGAEADDQQDPLDETRIHPEDYDLARKMAIDALELDEEDVGDEHPSHVVYQLMRDDDCAKKLDDLSLDDFAVNLLETMQDRKRYTLNMIKDELVHPYQEKRPKFVVPAGWEILSMLSGETPKTLYGGRPITVFVQRVKQHVYVKLDSGVDGIINEKYVNDDPNVKAEDSVVKGSTINAVIIDVVPERLLVELSMREQDIKIHSKPLVTRESIENFDNAAYTRDQEALERKRRQEVHGARRLIKHPEFRNVNASEAEQNLAKRPRGDYIIRPSSKGTDHLVVTWKVEEGIFQHIDVYDPDGGQGQSSVGNRLFVGQDAYSDLDELIVNHVHAIAKRMNDLMEHEKFRKGDKQSRHQYLREYVMANPNKSVYLFGLDRDHPGFFTVDFIVNKNTPVRTWHVRVTPRGYKLLTGDAAPLPGVTDDTIPSVPELCNAFKMRYLQLMAGGANTNSKTPYGAGLSSMTPSGNATPGYRTTNPVGRTPNPYPVGRTPNPYPVGRTPNPYPVGRTPNPYPVGRTPNPYGAAPTPNPYSQQPPPPSVPGYDYPGAPPPPQSPYPGPRGDYPGGVPPRSPYPDAGGSGWDRPQGAAASSGWGGGSGW